MSKTPSIIDGAIYIHKPMLTYNQATNRTLSLNKGLQPQNWVNKTRAYE